MTVATENAGGFKVDGRCVAAMTYNIEGSVYGFNRGIKILGGNSSHLSPMLWAIKEIIQICEYLLKATGSRRMTPVMQKKNFLLG